MQMGWLGAVSIAALLAGGATQACELKIGSPAVLSGPAAQWGMALRGGLEFAAAEAMRDKAIQIDGQDCMVSVIAIDSKYTAEGAAAAANSLAAEGVKVVIGAVGSPEVTGLKPIANRNRMLAMVSSYAKDAIGPQWPLVFHIGPGPSGWAAPIIDAAREKHDFHRVVTIAPNDQGGTDIASVNAEIFRDKGMEVSEEYYQRGTTNFAPIVTRIINAAPEAVDLASSPPGDAGILVKQLRQAGFAGPILRLGGPGYEEIVRVAGGNEVLGDFYWYEPVFKDEALLALDAEYQALMGQTRPENTLFYQWVAAARMVIRAANDAGSVDDAEKIAEALRGLPVEDKNFGSGHWIGERFFGVNQELSFPFAIGRVEGGVLQEPLRVTAVSED